jgi:hypothetical protein
MLVGGRPIREHIRLLRPLFAFITVVWLVRLALGAAGAPFWLLSVFSVTAGVPAAVFLAILLIHARNFGSYSAVVVASLLLNSWGQLLVIAAVVFSVVTNTTNVFTWSEFSIPGDDPLHLRHIYGHLTFGIGLGTLFGAGMGCLMLWLLRTMVPVGTEGKKGKSQAQEENVKSQRPGEEPTGSGPRTNP